MEDLKLIIAKNITELRRSRNITQGTLAEALNYSDKAISKWERGESLPDILVAFFLGRAVLPALIPRRPPLPLRRRDVSCGVPAFGMAFAAPTMNFSDAPASLNSVAR